MLKQYKISLNESNQKIEKYIRKILNDYSLSQIYKLFRKKDIKINGKWVDKSYILKENDIVSIYLPNNFDVNENKLFTKVQYNLNIKYEDDNILVVSKPYGLLVQEGKNNSITLTKQVISYLIDKGEYDPNLDKGYTPAPVHRLDRNTAGLVIFGKNIKSLQILGDAIKKHKCIEKKYISLVFNKLDGSGRIDLNLKKDEKNNYVRVVEKGGQEAHTLYNLIKSNNEFSLVEIQLLTGRTHQIRVHFSAIGNPIVGDKKYGDFGQNFQFEKNFNWENQFLHAHYLRFYNFENTFSYLNNLEIKDTLTINELNILNKIFK